MSKRILIVKTNREKSLKLKEDLIKANPKCKWSDNTVEIGDTVYILKVIPVGKTFLEELTGFEEGCVDASDLIEELDNVMQLLILRSKAVKNKTIHPISDDVPDLKTKVTYTEK